MAAIKVNYLEYDNDMKLVKLDAIARRKYRAKRFAVQKIAGLAMVAVGAIAPALFSGDATISLICVPVGLYALMTDEIIIH